MAAPTLVATAGVAFTGNTTPRSTASFTWSVGDVFVAIGIIENDGVSEALSISAGPTGGWTQQEHIGTNAANKCYLNLWTCVATNASSGVVTFTQVTGVHWGARVWQFSNAAVGTHSSLSSASKTITRSSTDADSYLCWGAGDWSAGTVPSVWTPASGYTSRDANGNVGPGAYSACTGDWSSHATASTAYGVSTGFGAGPIAKGIIEITGVAAAVELPRRSSQMAQLLAR